MKNLFERYGVYIVAVAAGAILTPVAIRTAELQRGYKAIGGEYLIIPLLVLVVYTVQEVKQGIKIFREENEGWN